MHVDMFAFNVASSPFPFLLTNVPWHPETELYFNKKKAGGGGEGNRKSELRSYLAVCENSVPETEHGDAFSGFI